MRQALRDLGCSFRLMCVAAHPDDEDGATLALHRYKYGIRTFAVLATRGEGGQNEIGPELYDDLAVIRTREMAAAARITGAEVHFLDLPEFGFSKSIEETESIWGPDEALRRVVRAIRELRPHVIITHHGRDKDHGHHQAIGRAVIEAFDRAADPDAYPEQLAEGLKPWQPSRLYVRAWQRGADSVELDISELDSLRGMTYAEMAAKALEAHASQGMAFFIERYLSGRPKVWYDLVKATPDLPGTARPHFGPLFDGLETDTAAPDFAELLTQPRERLFGALLAAATAEDGNPALSRALTAAAGWRLEARAVDPVVVPGETVPVNVEFTDFGIPEAREIRFTAHVVPSGVKIADTTIPLTAGTAEWTFDWALPPDLPCTLPSAAHVFEPGYLAPQVEVNADVVCGDMQVELETALHVDVAPAVLAEFLETPFLLRTDDRSPLPVSVCFTHFGRSPTDATVRMEIPEGWQHEPIETSLHFEEEGEQRTIEVRLSPPANPREGTYPVRMVLHAGTPHETAVQSIIHIVDVAVPSNLHVGLVKSYDNTIGDTLSRLGIPWAAIPSAGFSPDRLLAFGTVIVDMRAYQCRPDLVANNTSLLEYVRRGGRLLVMYQKTFDWRPEYAPYPLYLSRNRVTHEDAPVTHLVPDHPFFHAPNEIRVEDWSGWIQERGLYFPERWDAAYTPLIACNDPGEDLPPGAILAAKYGQGAYVYTALVWYRQLRECHPGALRLFANLLALTP